MSQHRYSRQFVALGAAVRELRSRRRMTQEGLAFESALHRNYVGAIERGQINPTFYTLMRLAQGLDVTLPELFEVFQAQHEYEARPADAGATVRCLPTLAERPRAGSGTFAVQ